MILQLKEKILNKLSEAYNYPSEVLEDKVLHNKFIIDSEIKVDGELMLLNKAINNVLYYKSKANNEVIIDLNKKEVDYK